ncbi:hypothetical protein D3C85_1731340 [compost metagenome]
MRLRHVVRLVLQLVQIPQATLGAVNMAADLARWLDAGDIGGHLVASKKQVAAGTLHEVLVEGDVEAAAGVGQGVKHFGLDIRA